MKNLMLNLFMLLATFQIISAQHIWEEKEEFDFFLKKIELIDKDTLYVISHSSVYKSTNGANDWEKSFQVGSGEVIVDIRFSSEAVGYILVGNNDGDSTLLYKTSNYGDDWTLKNSIDDPIFSIYSNVDFINDTVGFISTGDNIIYRTTDGGEHLDTIYEGGQVTDIVFTSDSVAYASIRSSSWSNNVNDIFKTENQGDDWTSVYFNSTGYFPADNELILEMDFINDNIGFVVGRNNFMLRTYDGGVTWVQLFPGEDNSVINSIDFVSTTRGFITMDGTVHKSTNAGFSFLSENVQYFSTVHSIQMIDLDVGYGITSVPYDYDGHSIFRRKNTIGLDDVVLQEDISIYPNPTFDEINISMQENIDLDEIRILSLEGRLINKIEDGVTNISLLDYPSGVYMIEFISKEGMIVKKIMKY